MYHNYTGWVRLGVVTSILWSGLILGLLSYEIISGENYYILTQPVPMSDYAKRLHNMSLNERMREYEKNNDIKFEDHYSSKPNMARLFSFWLIPIGLMWSIGLGVVWVREGFKKSV